jgi:hypothetical protein
MIGIAERNLQPGGQPRPMEVLPAPIMPTSATVFFNVMDFAYTKAGTARSTRATDQP